MLDKIYGIEERYAEIDRQLMEVGSDYQRAGELNKERIEIEPIVEIGKEYRQTLSSAGSGTFTVEVIHTGINKQPNGHKKGNTAKNIPVFHKKGEFCIPVDGFM